MKSNKFFAFSMGKLKIQNSRLKKVRWLLEGLGIAAVLWFVFSVLAGPAISRAAINRIAELTNTKIKAESVDFNLDGSVLIEQLVVSPYQRRKYDETILKAETVNARFSISSLLLLRPRIKKISVKDFVFNARHDLDTGQWNLAAIKIETAKTGVGKIPSIRLKRGVLQYSKVSNGKVEIGSEIPINARFQPAEKTQEDYQFTITTAAGAGSAQSTLTGSWRPGEVTVIGKIASAEDPELERTWMIDHLVGELNYDRSNNYSLKLYIKDLLGTRSPGGVRFSSDSRSSLKVPGPFNAMQRFFSRYQPAGLCCIELQASGDLGKLIESSISGKVHCKDIAICDRKFPYRIEHMTGPVEFDEKAVSLNNLSGRHNDVNLVFNGWRRDYGPNRQYEIQITSDNMALDTDLYNALNKKYRKLWSGFAPSGRAAVNYSLRRKPQTNRKTDLTIELMNAEATYHKFPYPLKNLTGRLSFLTDSVTVSDVVSQSGRRKITLNGKVTDRRTERPMYDISIKADNIPLGSTLAAALPERQRHFYNQLNMTGLANARVKIFTPEQDLGPTSFTADVSFEKTSLTVPVFEGSKSRAQPLKTRQSGLIVSDISAKTVFTADSINIANLTGRCDHGLVTLTGKIWPAYKDRQSHYRLSLRAEQTELTDELLSLLPRRLKKTALQLKANGKVNLTADLNKAAGKDRPDYEITTECLNNCANLQAFPYPLKDITGKVTFTNNSIDLQNVTATAADNARISPEASTIKVNGQVSLVDNTFSNARFELCARDILLDERLAIALPERLEQLYRKLSPAGRLDLELPNIKISNSDTGEKYVDFEGTAKFKDVAFSSSPAVSELNAAFTAQGRYKTKDGLCNCHAALSADSLRIKGKSLTSLKTDIYYDNRQHCWLTKNFIADCYDGKVLGNLECKQPTHEHPEYLVQVGFENIDLKRFLSETVNNSPVTDHESQTNNYTSGKMSGSLALKAERSENHTRIGRCRLIITDMQVGKLSPLAKLLHVLKLTEAKDYAFEQMLVDSYIQNKTLFFEKFDLSGHAIAFNGSGCMDLQNQDVDLTLTARGHRLATAEPSVLQSLTDNLGGAVVRMKVTGHFYDPQVTTTALPVIKDSLQILGTKPNTAH